jgi:hypothetical protein
MACLTDCRRIERGRRVRDDRGVAGDSHARMGTGASSTSVAPRGAGSCVAGRSAARVTQRTGPSARRRQGGAFPADSGRLNRETPNVDVETRSCRMEASSLDVRTRSLEVEAPGLRVQTPGLRVQSPSLEVVAPSLRLLSRPLDLELPDLDHVNRSHGDVTGSLPLVTPRPPPLRHAPAAVNLSAGRSHAGAARAAGRPSASRALRPRGGRRPPSTGRRRG